MTDKVRIDTLRADLLDANNETFLARQAEFESNVRSYPRKLPLAITKAEGVWLTDADNKQYRTASRAPVLALGHNHPDVLQSIQSVITSGLPLHTLDLTTPLKIASPNTCSLACRAKGKNIACSSPARPALTPWKPR